MAAHDSRLFQLQEDLFQEFLGYVCSVSNLGNLERLIFRMSGQNQEGTQGVVGLLGEHDVYNTRLSR